MTVGPTLEQTRILTHNHPGSFCWGGACLPGGGGGKKITHGQNGGTNSAELDVYEGPSLLGGM